jgi:hypothetical protein
MALHGPRMSVEDTVLRQQRSGSWTGGAAAIALACQGSTPAPSAGGAAGGTTVDVALAEWSVTPSTSSAAAGDVTFQVANKGTQVHELIVVKTDTKADALPVADGKVDEAGLDVIDEVEDVAVSSTADLVLTATGRAHALFAISAYTGMHAD